jgi:hypothetical protein
MGHGMGHGTPLGLRQQKLHSKQQQRSRHLMPFLLPRAPAAMVMQHAGAAGSSQ